MRNCLRLFCIRKGRVRTTKPNDLFARQLWIAKQAAQRKLFTGLGARTILGSVLESLTLQLAAFTLTGVQAEVQSGAKTGESLFSRLGKSCGLDPPTESQLNKLIPLPRVAKQYGVDGYSRGSGRLLPFLRCVHGNPAPETIPGDRTVAVTGWLC